MTRPREPEDKAGLHAVDVSDVLLHPLSPRERVAFTRTSSERAPATFLSRRADRRHPRTDRRDRPGREDAGVAGRPGHEGTRAQTDDLVIPAPGP